MTPEQQIAELAKPFAPHEIKRQRKMDYVSYPACVRRITAVYGIDWSWEIVREIVRDVDRNGKAEYYAATLGRLTAGGQVVEAWGGMFSTKGELGDALKGAGSYAFRKAASFRLVGLHLWEYPSHVIRLLSHVSMDLGMPVDEAERLVAEQGSVLRGIREENTKKVWEYLKGCAQGEAVKSSSSPTVVRPASPTVWDRIGEAAQAIGMQPVKLIEVMADITCRPIRTVDDLEEAEAQNVLRYIESMHNLPPIGATPESRTNHLLAWALGNFGWDEDTVRAWAKKPLEELLPDDYRLERAKSAIEKHHEIKGPKVGPDPVDTPNRERRS